MDPDDARYKLVEAAMAFDDAMRNGYVDTALNHARTMSANVQALDEWLAAGGFVPIRWEAATRRTM
jgi:hypothetical protein